jgi:hypothetical protein
MAITAQDISVAANQWVEYQDARLSGQAGFLI